MNKIAEIWDIFIKAIVLIIIMAIYMEFAEFVVDPALEEAGLYYDNPIDDCNVSIYSILQHLKSQP